MLELQRYEYMQPFFNAIEEVSCGDHHLKSDGLGQLNTNGIRTMPGQGMMLTQIQDGMG